MLTISHQLTVVVEVVDYWGEVVDYCTADLNGELAAVVSTGCSNKP